MKTYTNLYTNLCSYKNLLSAFKKARKGKTKKSYVIEFEKNLDINIKILQFELMNKLYKPKRLKLFIIRDPKTRKICKSAFRDRVVHHAIVNIIEPIYEQIFIYDSYANRKNKGQHKALARFDEFKKKVSRNGKKLNGVKDKNYVCGYCLKADIKKYFDNIDHKILINIIQEKTRDKNLIWLIQQILNNNLNRIKSKSMPLGNHTSQFLANVYLNKLDYFVKHKLKAKYYIRYVDDFAILDNNKEILEYYKEEINNYLKDNLEIKLHEDKSRIIPLHKGIPLLGFRNFYHCKLLRKRNVKKIMQNIEDYKKGKITKEKLLEIFQGWNAYAKWADSYNLRKEIVKMIYSGEYSNVPDSVAFKTDSRLTWLR